MADSSTFAQFLNCFSNAVVLKYCKRWRFCQPAKRNSLIASCWSSAMSQIIDDGVIDILFVLRLLAKVVGSATTILAAAKHE